MKKIFLLLLLAMATNAFSQDMGKSHVDSLLKGTWMLKDPTQAKIFTSSGEPFLRVVITFSERAKYSVEREQHVWEWQYSEASRKLTLIDMEMEVAHDYLVKSISPEELTIVMGKQEFVFKRINH